MNFKLEKGQGWGGIVQSSTNFKFQNEKKGTKVEVELYNLVQILNFKYWVLEENSVVG